MTPGKNSSAGPVTRAGSVTYSDLLYYIKSYAYYRLRREYGVISSPWHSRFYFRIVETKEQLNNTIAYILHNYQKHGLPEKYGREPYCFYDPAAVASFILD